MADWEMLIVDDGSTDNSVSIIQPIAEQDSRIRLIKKKMAVLHRHAIWDSDTPSGEYIQFLDADDTLAPDKFEKQIKRMENNHLDVSYTDYRMFNPDGSVEELRGLNESLFHLLVGWGPFGTIPPHCYLYKRDFIQTHKIAFAPIREREDWDWHIKVFSLHPNVQRLKGYCGAYYFRCPMGKTGTEIYRNYKEVIVIFYVIVFQLCMDISVFYCFYAYLYLYGLYFYRCFVIRFGVCYKYIKFLLKIGITMYILFLQFFLCHSHHSFTLQVLYMVIMPYTKKRTNIDIGSYIPKDT